MAASWKGATKHIDRIVVQFQPHVLRLLTGGIRAVAQFGLDATQDLTLQAHFDVNNTASKHRLLIYLRRYFPAGLSQEVGALVSKRVSGGSVQRYLGRLCSSHLGESYCSPCEQPSNRADNGNQELEHVVRRLNGIVAVRLIIPDPFA